MPSEFKTCIDCQQEFEFTEGEQQFYQDRDYTPPKRCKACSEKKKARFNQEGSRPYRAPDQY